MGYTINASYSANNCQYALRHSGIITAKFSVPEQLPLRLIELATGMVVLGAIGLWLFVA